MKKYLALILLGLILVPFAHAARRQPVPVQDNFFWAIYGGYNTGTQLVERASNGSINYNGGGSYYVALEANFVNPTFDYVLGVGFTEARPVSSLSGLASGALSNGSWGSLPIYFLTRYKLGEALYVTTGFSYSNINLQNQSAINGLHGSTSFTVNGNLGYLVGLGINLNSTLMLDLKYMVDRGSITLIGGSNNGNTYSLETSGIILSLGARI